MFFPIEGPPSPAFQRCFDAFLILFGIVFCIMSMDYACGLFSHKEISGSDEFLGGVLIAFGIISLAVSIAMIVASIWEFFRKRRHAKRCPAHSSH